MSSSPTVDMKLTLGNADEDAEMLRGQYIQKTVTRIYLVISLLGIFYGEIIL